MTLGRGIQERPRVAALMGVALMLAVAVAVWLGGALAGRGDMVPVSELRAAEARAANAARTRAAADARADRLAAQERAAQREIGRLERRLGQWVAYANGRVRAQRRRGDRRVESRPAAAAPAPR